MINNAYDYCNESSNDLEKIDNPYDIENILYETSKTNDINFCDIKQSKKNTSFFKICGNNTKNIVDSNIKQSDELEEINETFENKLVFEEDKKSEVRKNRSGRNKIVNNQICIKYFYLQFQVRVHEFYIPALHFSKAAIKEEESIKRELLMFNLIDIMKESHDNNEYAYKDLKTIENNILKTENDNIFIENFLFEDKSPTSK